MSKKIDIKPKRIVAVIFTEWIKYLDNLKFKQPSRISGADRITGSAVNIPQALYNFPAMQKDSTNMFKRKRSYCG